MALFLPFPEKNLTIFVNAAFTFFYDFF